ncbi:hypothetical protein [Geomonas sp.]|uniref:hypothetical protein n=1 Tax=Geomonas sp. TaxID=2651584 RepID=UPI002B4A1B4C|nr:hypothetical protein [Geomonas sp.]HJV33771.1 hypothetical protein [Geomonas sp.]
MRNVKILAVWMMLIATGLLAGCGGGGGSSSNIPVVAASKVSGVAATGSPIVGTVYLNDSSTPSKQLSQTTNSDGSFSFDVSGMTAPFILRTTAVDGNGQGYTLFSFANAAGTANINPLSNLAVLQANGAADPATLSTPTAAQLAAIKAALANVITQIQTLLAPVLTDYGVAGRNFITDSFLANHSGLDLLFDYISISVSGGTLTITNKLNNATILVTTVGGPTLTGTVNTANLPTIPPNLSLFGTYTLSGFEITYADGSSLTSTSPGIMFSGTFQLNSNNTASQSVTVNGYTVNNNATWSYDAATGKFTFVTLPSGATSVLTVVFSNNMLTTICPTSTFTEYDHWTKVSNHVTRAVKSPLEQEILTPSAPAGTLAAGLLGVI